MTTMPLLYQTAVDAAGAVGPLISGGVAVLAALIAVIPAWMTYRNRKAVAEDKRVIGIAQSDIAKAQMAIEADKLEIAKDRFLFAQQKDLYDRILRQVQVLERRLDRSEKDRDALEDRLDASEADRKELHDRCEVLERENRQCRQHNEALAQSNTALVESNASLVEDSRAQARVVGKHTFRITQLEETLGALRQRLADALKIPLAEV